MKLLLPAFALLALACLSFAVEPDYPLTEDSKPHDGVPKGELIKFRFESIKVFPGTTREVTVYVPQQYDGTKGACVYVNQDGVQWNAPTVFDNLIARGEIPVLIGIFITPGVVKALDGEKALDRFNRSVEYDGLGPAYSKLLQEEVFPAVQQKTTTDGRKILLSKSGNDRAIGGSSSGAICAFTAGWERPDAFSRVFTSICTMVGLRGANNYPTLVRKYEPKPLRIFQQDGENDNNSAGGDWWMSNQELERALTFAGYEHDHIWGQGGHNGKQGAAVFPDVMRYLWKGWPEPIKTLPGRNAMINDLLIPGENWQLVWEGGKFTEGPAANAKGEVFFNDIPNSKTYKVALDGTVSEFLSESKQGNGQAFGPDGRLYAVTGTEPKIYTYDAKGQGTEIASGITGNDLTVLANGNIYVTEPMNDPAKPNNVWLIKPDGSKQIVDTGLKFPNGITASPDQSLLYVDETRSHWVYSFQIQPDGTLKDKQRFYWLHVPDTAEESGADGMEVDTMGRLYVATRLGLQIADQAGKVNAILPSPNGKCSNVALGGANLDTLFITAGDKVYKRKINAHAALNSLAPVRPPAPHL